MDLAIQFKKLEEGQNQILQFLNQKSDAQVEELKIYTLQELAKLFSVSVRTIYNWKDAGRLPYVSVGSKTFVTNDQVIQFLSENSVKTF